MSLDQVCRKFMDHRCRHGPDCRYIHDKTLCYEFWRFGNCKYGENCRKNHFVTTQLREVIVENPPKEGNNHRERRVKNTESFDPCYDPPNMRVLVEYGKEKCELKLQTQDVVLIPDFFKNDGSIYQKLVDEVSACGNDIFVSWHGDSHFIANDKKHFKEKCPTYLSVIEKIKNYFNMRIEATRFNWYSNDDEFKPMHFDAAGVKPEKALTQNFTVAVSFGKERVAAFEEVGSKKITGFPAPDGSCYCFTRDLNIKYRHGILAVRPENRTGEGRVSVIVWGWKDQDEVK